jgi:zinc protease
MKAVRLLVVLLATAAFGASTATAQVPAAEQVQALTLSNGMQIIVWRDADIPNVTLYNWVHVGSRNEAPGITGLAHFFEHMMFNGTSTSAPGDFDRTLEANGARNNAFTSSDVTVYQDWFPSAALDTIFRLEADRLRNLSFDSKVVESERGVVYSERRRSVEDNLGARLNEQVQATAFLAHPYGIPTIGWPSDIESWTVADLKRFFTTYYAPNNCTLVIVGDVDSKNILALAQKYLEPIPRQEPPPTVRTKEPEQRGERRVLIEADAQTPLLQFSYHGIAAADARAPALDLLMRILADGDASRLRRVLVEEQKLAISVDQTVDAGFDPGLISFFLGLPGDGDLQHTEQVFTEQIEKLINDGVTSAELARARNQALADFWRQLATVDGKARALGEYAVLGGDYHKLFNAPAAYESVTVADLKKLAAEFLRTSNRTVGVLRSAGEHT